MSVVARREAEEERFKESCLKVVAIESFGNGAQDVDPDLTEITVRFDRPLTGRLYKDYMIRFRTRDK